MLDLGIIVMWAGTLANIPGGWTICDGTLGTPDLRDRFVRGAGPGSAPHLTGGAADHTHDFTSDGHFHALPTGAPLGAGANFANFSDFRSVTGTTDPESLLPPYYTLAYIMRI